MRRFFERAIDLKDLPEKVTIVKSSANTVALHSQVADSDVSCPPNFVFQRHVE